MSNEHKQQELVQMNVAFYQSFLSAWIESRMEKDKQILTLSALAIGLLMTFRDGLQNNLALFLWLVSSCVFVAVIVIILLIFAQNSDYIEKIIRNDNESKKIDIESALHRKTFFAFLLFIVGIILTIILAAFGPISIIINGD